MKRVVISVVLASLAGCALFDDRLAEEVVAERAMEQANLLMAGDYEAALEYMTPSFQNGPKAQNYRADKAAVPSWRAAALKWVKCDPVDAPERCEVRLLVTVTRPPSMNVPIQVPLDDVWILVDGKWYQYD